MSGFSPEAAASFLAEARAARRTLDTLGDVAPRNEAEAAATQTVLAGLRGASPPGGFKIGATAKRMQEYLGLSGPAAGFMAHRDIHADGVRLTFADFRNPGVECELAVRLARDIPPGPCTAAQAASAVGDFMAAIEIVENRYGALDVLGTPSLIADQVFHAAAVTGTPFAAWRETDIAALGGRIRIAGQEKGSGVARDLLGHPMNSLAWLASSPVAAVFGGLKAGQVVMLGSVTPPMWMDAPGAVEVEFDGMAPVRVILA